MTRGPAKTILEPNVILRSQAYHYDGLEAWDFLPDGGGVVMVSKSSSAAFATADGRRWNGNSELREIAWDGALRRSSVVACTGRNANYNAASHECRVDRGSPGLSTVFTVRYAVRFYADEEVPILNFPGVPAKPVHANAFAGAKIATWDRSTGALADVYDMFDLASPDDALFPSTTWSTMSVYCSGAGDGDAALLPTFDYHHVDAVSLGSDGDLVVSSRTLNTVWGLARDGSGANWALSSSLNASRYAYPFYAFERPADAFYAPHAAVQLASGRLLLVDDGDSRPGCTNAVSAGCFSRVVEYELDAATSTARLVWQFEWGVELAGGTNATWTEAMLHDGYNPVGGSVYELPSGHLLVGFTSVAAMQRKWNPKGTAPVFEFAPRDTGSGYDLVAKLLLPEPLANNGLQNAYRVVPWSQVHAESTARPS